MQGGAQLGEERLVERPVHAAGGVQTQHRDGLGCPGIAVRGSALATRFVDVLVIALLSRRRSRSRENSLPRQGAAIQRVPGDLKPALPLR